MADVALPAFKKRTNKTSNIRKRPATPPPDNAASDSDYTSDEEAGVRIKRRKREGLAHTGAVRRELQSLCKFSAFAADRTATLTATDDATKTSNWHTEAANAAETARLRAQHARETQDSADADGVYKGAAGYSNFMPSDREPGAGGKLAGPVKGSTNVRTITVTDFAPDVCKDYKQTGFCGYGDGCKYLHAREDYKQGWQLDKEWEKAGKDKKPGTGKGDVGDGDDEEKMLEKIPFKCIICREDYKRPVVTKCGHYFCEKCAMRRYMREKRKQCANCGMDTGGTFGVARKLNELLERKRKREAEKEQSGDGDVGGK
ncbi:RNA-splicing factor [Teratosphaeriaceae sp. CCFEE 6253]|nr:RNA-splicing factor [Teratosphaeriaceae sp. CCFEE 6253]